MLFSTLVPICTFLLISTHFIYLMFIGNKNKNNYCKTAIEIQTFCTLKYDCCTMYVLLSYCRYT